MPRHSGLHYFAQAGLAALPKTVTAPVSAAGTSGEDHYPSASRGVRTREYADVGSSRPAAGRGPRGRENFYRPHLREGVLAPRAVSDALLRGGVSGPGECRLRQAPD